MNGFHLLIKIFTFMSLNFPIRKSSSGLSDEPISDNDFNEAINLFKAQRKKSGISLDQLSNETKISRNVLIAIENGWKKYLPEKTYLNSMIKSLETNLNLERGSLNALSVQENGDDNISRFKFNFINIDFLNSWFGSFLYIILMLLSILVLNSQLRYLIKTNSISTEPIIIEKTLVKNENVLKTKKEK